VTAAKIGVPRQNLLILAANVRETVAKLACQFFRFFCASFGVLYARERQIAGA